MLDFTGHIEYHGSSEEGAVSQTLSGMTRMPLKGRGELTLTEVKKRSGHRERGRDMSRGGRLERAWHVVRMTRHLFCHNKKLLL